MERPSRYPALAKILEIAHQIGARDAEGALTMRRIVMAVAEARMGYRPLSIDTAPRLPAHIVLLYCPRQGGWQTGEWYPGKNRWVSNMNMDTLHPTDWAEVPLEPKIDEKESFGGKDMLGGPKSGRSAPDQSAQTPSHSFFASGSTRDK